MQKIEFIESYIKRGGDYQWNDNHGELIRCKDCSHTKEVSDGIICKKYMVMKQPEGFCDAAEKRKTE
jgi:hypothetical protein